MEIDLNSALDDIKPSALINPDTDTVDCDALPSQSPPPPPVRPKGRNIQSVFDTIDYFVVQNGYQCAACPQNRRVRMFRDLPELRRHMVQHVSGVKCNHCDETFPRVDALRKHLLDELDLEYGPAKTNEENDDHEEDDGAVLPEEEDSDLGEEKQINYIVKEGALACSVCGAEFGPVTRWNKEKFKMHVGKEHWKPGAFRCVECGRRFTDAGKLERHMKLHADVGWMGMDATSSFEGAEDGLDECIVEEEDALDIKPSVVELNDSMQVQLNELPLPEIFIKTEPEEEEDVLEDVPEVKVRAKRERSESESSSSSSPSANSGSESEAEVEVQIFTNKKLKAKAEDKARRQKLRKEHSRQISGGEDGSIILACNLCDEGFLRQELLDRHITQKHDDRDRPFRCDQCPKTYISNGNLQEHVKMVHAGVKFPCKVCGIQLSTKSSWKRHMKSHTKNGYNCEICGEKCSSHSVLAKHKRRVHENIGNSFICVDCGNTYDSNAALREHRVAHTEERPWECNICGMKFKRNHNLLNHQKRTHLADKKPIIMFKCPDCDEEFPSKSKLVLHRPIHGKVTCRLCQQTFDTQVDLMRHRREDHQITKREPGVNCRTCNERCPDQEALIKHREEHHPTEPAVECDICKAVFSSVVGLRIHKREHRRNVQLHNCPNCTETFNCQLLLDTHLKEIHANEKNYVCDQCGNGYPTRKQLASHLSRHRAPLKKSSSRNSPGQYMCELCGKEFNFKITLKRHMVNIHLYQRNFKCEACDKICLSAEGLKLHQRTVHSDEQLEICELCGKGFAQPYRLREHMARHAREKIQLRCHMCNRVFRDVKKLERHIKTHTGETKFSCVPCQRHFAIERHYRLHMKRMHESSASCPECDKLFPTEKRMKSHMRIHENPNLFECPICYACIKEKKHFDHHVRLHDKSNGERLPCRFCPMTFRLQKTRRLHEVRFHKEQRDAMMAAAPKSSPKKRVVKRETVITHPDAEVMGMIGGMSYEYPYGVAPREDEVSVD